MRVAALVAVLALMTAGCSLLGDGDGDEPASSGDGPAGDVLRLALPGVGSLDPTRASTVAEQLLSTQLFGTLTTFDEETGEVSPGLAEAWSAAPDGLTWTIRLGDHTFADGSPITATDVEYTLDRAANRTAGSLVADLLEPVAGWRELDGSATGLAGVSTAGERELTITLTEPWGALPVALAQPGLGIVPVDATFPAIDELDAPDDLPSSSGAFELVDAGEGLLGLAALDADARRGAGDVRSIVASLHADATAAYTAFANGDADWAPVPADRIEEAADRFGAAHMRSYVAELFYTFDLRDPKWTDVRLREAVVRAVDVDEIVRSVYGERMVPMRSFTVEGIAGGGTDRCGDACRFDPDRSRALLSEIVAERGAAPSIAIDFEDDETQSEVAAAVAGDLEAVGLAVERRPKPLGDYEAFAVSGEQDLFRLGWIAAYPSADAFVSPLFRSTSANNLSGYSSPAVDDLIARARAAASTADAAALYGEAEAVVLRDFAVLPIGHFRQHWVASERAGDIDLGVMGTFDAAAVDLASP